MPRPCTRSSSGIVSRANQHSSRWQAHVGNTHFLQVPRLCRISVLVLNPPRAFLTLVPAFVRASRLAPDTDDMAQQGLKRGGLRDAAGVDIFDGLKDKKVKAFRPRFACRSPCTHKRVQEFARPSPQEQRHHTKCSRRRSVVGQRISEWRGATSTALCR